MPIRPRHSARARRPGFWRHWTLWIYFPLAMLLILGCIGLWRSGRWLVAEDSFEKARWAVILAGESRDVERSDAALKLYLDGRIDTAIYSATRIFKDRYASEFMVDYLARGGYPREKLFEFRQDAYSTLEEARALIRQFRWQNLDTVLIITTNYHTARTGRIFRKLAQGYPHILVHAAEYPFYEPSAWWSSREGQKLWLLEWAKTIATYFELMGQPPETGKAESNGLIGGGYGGGSFPPEPPLALINPTALPADTGTGADSLAVSGDTSGLEPDSAGFGADSGSLSSTEPDAADSAASEAKESKETGIASPKSGNKESAADKKPAKKGTAGAAKESAVSNSRSSSKKAGAKSGPAASKPAAKKPAEKPKKKPSR